MLKKRKYYLEKKKNEIQDKFNSKSHQNKFQKIIK